MEVWEGGGGDGAAMSWGDAIEKCLEMRLFVSINPACVACASGQFGR